MLTIIGQKRTTYWQPNALTPNERYNQDDQYRKLLRLWANDNGIRRVDKMFQVRIVSQASPFTIHQSTRWWDDRRYMDQIFWVFQTPHTFWMGEEGKKEPCQFYALEFFECQCIVQDAINQFGYNPFTNEVIDPVTGPRLEVNHCPSLLVPATSCVVAWEEMQAGYSEHINWAALERKEKPKTQAEIDKEGIIKEEVARKTKELYDVANDPKWLTKKENLKGTVFDDSGNLDR